VEHACYQCGATVEDGIAFCPQCNAPQIRIAASEAVTHPGTASEMTPAQPTYYASAPQASGIQWSLALPAAALAGLVAILMIKARRRPQKVSRA